MAAIAADLMGAGTSKCGWPMLRLIGFFRLRANSKTLRMPDDSMCCIRSAIHGLARRGIQGAPFVQAHGLPPVGVAIFSVRILRVSFPESNLWVMVQIVAASFQFA